MSFDGREEPRATGPSSGRDARFAHDCVHRLRFTTDVFAPANPVLRDVLAAAPDARPRAVVFVDAGVARAWPDLNDRVRAYADASDGRLEIVGELHVVPGGEAAKQDWGVYQAVASAINDEHICRHSWVLAIGGGAMLDAVGFAAATAHRGVRLVRFPTTTLAQDDAGIGVKNGINAFGKKNFLGAFSVPWAVINDERFLETLDDRDWRAGLSEAVKVALLKDAALFEHIVAAAPSLRQRDAAALRPIVRRSAELHLEHITEGGDPFEERNARPLDFGHWSAHRLEQLTDFRLRHGEAVAIGLAIDVVYARLSGLLDEVAASRVLDCLDALGFDLVDPALQDTDALLAGLEEFREHLGGRLTITLIRGIGHPVDVHEIDRDRMVEAIQRLGEYAGSDRRERSA